jgi:hypothetical protein
MRNFRLRNQGVGSGNSPVREKEEVPMSDIDTRIEQLLDQLENPNLSEKDVRVIERKIEVLRGQQT